MIKILFDGDKEFIEVGDDGKIDDKSIFNIYRPIKVAAIVGFSYIPTFKNTSKYNILWDEAKYSGFRAINGLFPIVKDYKGKIKVFGSAINTIKVTGR